MEVHSSGFVFYCIKNGYEVTSTTVRYYINLKYLLKSVLHNT